jgi:thiaminase (transcriptional activator TenA)
MQTSTRQSIRILAVRTLALLAAIATATVPGWSADENAFTRQLWKKAEPSYQAALAHPYLTGLGDGSLPKEKFRYYLVQDALYLRVFGQALSLLAAKAPNEEWALTLNQHAMDTLKAERELHADILASAGMTVAEINRTPMAPVNAAYTNHLIATVSQRPFIEGLAAVLPCYWVYLEVGKHLARQGSPDPEYARWIKQYAGEAFEEPVQAVLGMMDQIAGEESPGARERAMAIYDRSTRYEYLFWDMAWREEQWLP